MCWPQAAYRCIGIHQMQTFCSSTSGAFQHQRGHTGAQKPCSSVMLFPCYCSSGFTPAEESLVMRERLFCMQEGQQTAPIAGEAASSDVLATNEPDGAPEYIFALPPSP